VVGSDAALGSGAGAVTFDGGTLQIASDFLSGRAITLAGSGTFNTGTFSALLSGSLSGSGHFTKRGAGTLFLTGTNTYTGGTTIAEGTLVGNTSSLQGSIANHGVVVFDQSGSGSFNGTISGSGSVMKTGAGVLSFSGAHSYTGFTDILAGTLRLNGSLAGTVRVADGATLNVGGVPAGPLALGAAGAGPTFGIGGDLSLARGSIYQAVIGADGSTPTLSISGGAYIDGATLDLAASSSTVSFARTAVATLLQASTIVGGFSRVTGVAGLLDVYLLTKGNQLQLLVSRPAVDFRAFASAGAGSEVGGALSSLQSSASGDLAFVLRELRTLESDAELSSALDDVSGAHHGARAGVNVLGASDVADAIGVRFTRRAGPWVQALGRSISLDERVDPGAPRSEGAGSLAGFDWRTGSTTFGVAAGYTADTISLFARNDEMRDKAYRGAIYGERAFGSFFVNATAAGAFHAVRGARSMSFAARLNGDLLFGGVNRTAAFDYDALETAGTIDAGYALMLGGFAVRPSAGLQVMRLSHDQFSERGADSLDLTAPAQSVNSQAARFRISAARPFKGARGIEPRLDVRYARELGSRVIPFRASIGGAAFTTQSFALPDDTFIGQAGFAASFSRATVSVDYRMSFALGQRQHLLSIGLGK
jgi:autotransporter-associated beta strand protein